jgi:hypothetical protein
LHSRPIDGGIKDVADAERLATCVQSLLAKLTTDRRVDLAYGTWLTIIGLDDALLARVQARRGCADPTEDDLRDVLIVKAALASDSAEQDAFVRVLASVLKLTYAWLPPALLAEFRVRCYSEATGTNHAIALRMPASTSPRGRARHNHRDLARNVDWYYRAEIQRPTETIGALAREYAAAVGRRTRAISVVQNGIRQAKEFLAAAVYLPK